jgi:gas vesicle protein
MEIMEDNSDKLIWFFAGAALGATIALLYAPQSGKDTRRYITKKTREGREVLSDTSKDLMDKGRDLYEKGRRVADDAAELFERGRRLVEG